MLSYLSFPNGSHSGEILSMLVKLYRRCTPKFVGTMSGMWPFAIHSIGVYWAKHQREIGAILLLIVSAFVGLSLWQNFLWFICATFQALLNSFLKMHQYNKKKLLHGWKVRENKQNFLFFPENYLITPKHVKKISSPNKIDFLNYPKIKTLKLKENKCF